MQGSTDFTAEKGFGMIDALLGTMLLGIVVAGFMAAFGYTTAGTGSNTCRTEAGYIAQEVMENFRVNDGQAALDFSTVPASVTRDRVTYTVAAAEVAANEINSATNLKQFLKPVQFTVSWTESGRPRTLSLISYYYLD